MQSVIHEELASAMSRAPTLRISVTPVDVVSFSAGSQRSRGSGKKTLDSVACRLMIYFVLM